MNTKFYIRICTLFLAMLTAAISAQAATRTVTNLSDSGTGSLRQAIADASPGDTIIFANGLVGSIQLTDTLLLNKNLTISGPGADVLAVLGRNSPTEEQVFSQTAGTVLISGLRIADGFTSGAGGGIGVDGGSLTLNACLLDGNIAESAGGVFVGTGSTLTITNSTITGNQSFVEGGGVSNRGGTLVLRNSTITGNIAPQGGGVSVEGGGTATILNSTISNNGVSSPQMGDVGGLRVTAGSTANIRNTIVAQNIGSMTAPADVGGTVNSQGNNLIGNTTGGFGFIASDLLNVNPLLGSLLFNGGTTQTQALLAGSPAIDAGNNTGATATDQRGVARPQNTTVDIGAYESGVSGWTGQTNTGVNVSVVLGTTTLSYSSVTVSGTTTVIPYLPPPSDYPINYACSSSPCKFPGYDISTTTTYTAPITVCVQVPSVTDLAEFNRLRILHNEGGMIIDRTILSPDTPAPNFATRTICARVNSLSPFVVAEFMAPTAANVSVGGRVLTAQGRGMRNARVTLTDANGTTRTAITASFGYYRFDEVEVGQTYVVSVRSKRYQFSNPTQVVTLMDEVNGLTFIALPE